MALLSDEFPMKRVMFCQFVTFPWPGEWILPVEAHCLCDAAGHLDPNADRPRVPVVFSQPSASKHIHSRRQAADGGEDVERLGLGEMCRHLYWG